MTYSPAIDTLLERRWSDAIQRYHETFGPGYADDWPAHLGYLIPNIVSDIEIDRLRVRVPQSDRKEDTR
mgnify:CR=1 FL=1